MAKPRFLNLFVLLATAVYCVVASPTGAPSSVCDSMVPGHSVLEQTGASPYVIELSTTKYCPNRTVSVTLKGSTDSETFKGFLCQARTAVDTYVTSGQLTSADTKASKNNCVSKATLTHGNRDVKNSFYMTWTPDATGTGDIYIVCTIVKEKTTFWVKQSTRAITYAGMDACSTDGKETEKPGTCPTPTGAGKCLVLLSGDDYYLISSGLATQETTIGNSNPALYRYVTKDTVLEGIRTMVANRIAESGDEWARTFAMYNSGTYNNQWMVVDYRQFTPGFAPGKGLLTILEQIPGTVKYEDKTDLLKQQTYWPSYNIAYFPEIFNKSGCWDNVRKYGDWFTYDKAPRAQMFKRDHVKVKDLESMQRLMRYNDFKHDPLARCNCTPPYSGENGISARCDLNPANGTYPFETLGHRSHGGTDMKLTNYAMFKNLEFIAISGPTYDQLPPFQWSKADFEKDCPHFGHPDLFKFGPVRFNGTFIDTTTASVDISLQ